MKIVLTGGGTGGHFYPLIAVAEAIREVATEEKLFDPQMYYFAPSAYNERALYENDIQFVRIPAGKLRRYFSLKNVTDMFKSMSGSMKALRKLFSIYPDVVFSKGGYASVPVIAAARLLSIPVVIHESDSVPGRANKWAGKFAERIAVSYPEAASHFPENRVAHTGQPIRKGILKASPKDGGCEFFKFDANVPVVLILGGSQGAKMINDIILDALPTLVEKYQVIHQTGEGNLTEVKQTAEFILKHNKNASRYRPYPFLNPVEMQMAAGAADIVVSRAGSTIFEIAAWGKPSIIIPIPEEISHDQRKNAFSYARAGACVVIEEKNLSDDILLSQINQILEDPEKRTNMQERAKAFSKSDSAHIIAKEIVEIGLTHENRR